MSVPRTTPSPPDAVSLHRAASTSAPDAQTLDTQVPQIHVPDIPFWSRPIQPVNMIGSIVVGPIMAALGATITAIILLGLAVIATLTVAPTWPDTPIPPGPLHPTVVPDPGPLYTFQLIIGVIAQTVAIGFGGTLRGDISMYSPYGASTGMSLVYRMPILIIPVITMLVVIGTNIVLNRTSRPTNQFAIVSSALLAGIFAMIGSSIAMWIFAIPFPPTSSTVATNELRTGNYGAAAGVFLVVFAGTLIGQQLGARKPLVPIPLMRDVCRGIGTALTHLVTLALLGGSIVLITLTWEIATHSGLANAAVFLLMSPWFGVTIAIWAAAVGMLAPVHGTLPGETQMFGTITSLDPWHWIPLLAAVFALALAAAAIRNATRFRQPEGTDVSRITRIGGWFVLPAAYGALALLALVATRSRAWVDTGAIGQMLLGSQPQISFDIQLVAWGPLVFMLWGGIVELLSRAIAPARTALRTRSRPPTPVLVIGASYLGLFTLVVAIGLIAAHW
ncbi:hypothetical protein [Devriesea agamarum]|uniref:hypothetical protein n=1 Tax=Devriesea agamarum TaxID=472569 RepID=UPI00071C4B06|nr:hypothetical protein [Devriesea agamarum]